MVHIDYNYHTRRGRVAAWTGFYDAGQVLTGILGREGDEAGATRQYGGRAS